MGMITTPAAAGAGGRLHPQLVPMVQWLESPHDGDKRTPELEPAMCPVGAWTVGYGHVLTHPQTGRQLHGEADRALAMVVYRQRWPQGLDLAGAAVMLEEDLAAEAAGVDAAVTVPLTPAQRAALASFRYNVGAAAFAGSTLLRKLNAGDVAGAAAQFAVWNKGTVNGRKVVLGGLVRRRKAERLLFEGGDWRDAAKPERMAQAVEAPAVPKPLVASHTAQAAAGVVATGGLGVAAGVVELLGPVAQGVTAVQGVVAQARDAVQQAQAVAGDAAATVDQLRAAGDQVAGVVAVAGGAAGLDVAAILPLIGGTVALVLGGVILWRLVLDRRAADA